MYQGGKGWDKWIAKFESVASVNGWEAADNLRYAWQEGLRNRCKDCQRKNKLEEYVHSTLEVESYLVKPATVASIGPEVDEITV